MPISIFTPCSQSGEEFKGILGVAFLEVLDPFLDRVVECGAFLVVEVVATTGKHLIQRHQLDLFAFGAIGRLVNDEASVPDAGSQRLLRIVSKSTP